MPTSMNTLPSSVEHIFQRRVVPFRAASPELDQEVAGDQHEFPEDEERNQIQRDEDTHRRRLEGQGAIK